MLLQLEAVLFPHNALGERLLAQEIELGLAWVVGAPAYGYVLTRDDGYIVDVTRLGVAPAQQGRGVGSRLLKAALQLGRDTMLTVEKWNTRALNLYRRSGFIIVGSLVTSDAWVMKRAAQNACETYSVPQPPHL